MMKPPATLVYGETRRGFHLTPQGYSSRTDKAPLVLAPCVKARML